MSNICVKIKAYKGTMNYFESGRQDGGGGGLTSDSKNTFSQ